MPAPVGGVEAAVEKVRRRRTARRSGLAAAVAVLVTISVAVLFMVRRSEPPVIEPTPPPVSASPVPAGAHPWLLPFDADTATLQITDGKAEKPSAYWHTNDGGTTFTSYPADRPPVEAIMSVTQGRYRMLCPGATGLEGAAQIGCEQAQLVKIGSGPVATQPPVRTSIFETRIWEGADGRLWLLARPQRAPERLYVSDDGTQTWKELPLPTEEAVGTLNLSPDGKQVWVTVFGSEEFWFWELTGSEWVKRDLKADRSMVPILLQDNIWLVRRGDTLTYLTEGVPTTALAPLTRHYGGRVLRDGTVVLTSGNEMLLGIGSGTRRDWVRITTQG